MFVKHSNLSDNFFVDASLEVLEVYLFNHCKFDTGWSKRQSRCHHITYFVNY